MFRGEQGTATHRMIPAPRNLRPQVTKPSQAGLYSKVRFLKNSHNSPSIKQNQPNNQTTTTNQPTNQPKVPERS